MNQFTLHAGPTYTTFATEAEAIEQGRKSGYESWEVLDSDNLISYQEFPQFEGFIA